MKEMDEIIIEAINVFGTKDKALIGLQYAIKYLNQSRTLVYPNPVLTELEQAYYHLFSLNYGAIKQ